jgi:hypothetical protein
VIVVRVFDIGKQNALFNSPDLIFIRHWRVLLAIVFGTHDLSIIILHMHVPTPCQVLGIAQAPALGGLLFGQTQRGH